MAGESLGQPDANLTVLRAAVPQDDEASRDRQEAQPQPWNHGPLIPIRVILREFVARSLLAAGQAAEVTGDTLWNHIVETLPSTLRDFAQPLRDELEHTGGLLLLDGLDEVPEADQHRAQVKSAVEQFATLFPKVRILVTSRIYAYQRQDWKLRGFTEAGLAPFSAAQIRAFVERWYAHVGPARGLSANDIRGQTLLLNDAIRRNPHLSELAVRPLLLTLMASLHAWRQGKLPNQREELYADDVELLLDQWESRKLMRQPDGTYEITEPSVAEWLRVDRVAVQQALNRLAFEAHRDQPHPVGTADIPQATLVSALMGLNPNLDPDRRPARLLEFLRDRAGLLEPRGVGIYAFPHRTFQEYLAACHLTERDDFPNNIADLLRADPNRWREVTLLAGAKAVRGAVAYAWLLADALCPEAPPDQRRADESGYWGALLAAQVLTENRSLRSTIAERNPPKVEHIRQWLVCTLRHGALSPVDRAQAGDALAIIGDPRFRADAWHLPDEPLLGFVEIPAGSFLMGSLPEDKNAVSYENPQHPVTLPTYYMARYPTTVAQFRAYVHATGYEPQNEGSLRGLPNHPVVYVTWYDALKYCDWLTERLRDWDGTPEPLASLLRREGWYVTMPSEAEWEKAARGTDGRIYPWGNDLDPNRANYEDTSIGAVSAVGGFPYGASPYGIEDLSGNVWEWTRSLWGRKSMRPDFTYPYKPDDGREHREAPRHIVRVLRGGAFSSPLRVVRCAYRDWLGPLSSGRRLGFRVVVLLGF
jgi:formylglycine-generating enzyme required for sulfatase activity